MGAIDIHPIILGQVFAPIAFADMGPKPSIDITVKGMPDDNYILDLLVDEEADCENIELTAEEKDLLSEIIDYNDPDGYQTAALLEGTSWPLYGNLWGTPEEDDTYLHSFGNMGTPSVFKIIIMTAEGKLIVSDTIERKQFNAKIEYDVSEAMSKQGNQINAGKVNIYQPIVEMILPFISRLIATLLIELGIGWLLGFRSKKSIRIIVITNAVTQIFLNVLLLSEIYSGLLMAFLLFIIGEIVIFIAELITYLITLKEQDPGKRVLNAFLANLASSVGGYFLLMLVELLRL